MSDLNDANQLADQALQASSNFNQQLEDIKAKVEEVRASVARLEAGQVATPEQINELVGKLAALNEAISAGSTKSAEVLAGVDSIDENIPPAE